MLREMYSPTGAVFELSSRKGGYFCSTHEDKYLTFSDNQIYKYNLKMAPKIFIRANDDFQHVIMLYDHMLTNDSKSLFFNSLVGPRNIHILGSDTMIGIQNTIDKKTVLHAVPDPVKSATTIEERCMMEYKNYFIQSAGLDYTGEKNTDSIKYAILKIWNNRVIYSFIKLNQKHDRKKMNGSKKIDLKKQLFLSS